MKTTAIGIRLPNHLLDKVEEYGLENFPKGDSYDKTATIVELISKGLGLDDVQQPVKQDVIQEIEAIKKRLQNLEDKFVKQDVGQVVRQNNFHENAQEAALNQSEEVLAIEERKAATEAITNKEEITPLYSEDDLMKMQNFKLRDILKKLPSFPSDVAAKKLNKKKLVEAILKAQKLKP